MAMLAAPLLTSVMGSAAAGTFASVAGTLFSGLSLIGDYMSQKNLAKSQAQQGIYEQKVAEQNAGQIEAQSQRQTVEALRQKSLVASSAKARIADGGGNSADPTSVNLVADIEARGTENAYNELYSGQSRADAVRQGGDMSAYQGRVNSASTKATAMSSLVGGVASLATKYGGGGFKSSSKVDPNGLILWDDGSYSGSGYR